MSLRIWTQAQALLRGPRTIGRTALSGSFVHELALVRLAERETTTASYHVTSRDLGTARRAANELGARGEQLALEQQIVAAVVGGYAACRVLGARSACEQDDRDRSQRRQRGSDGYPHRKQSQVIEFGPFWQVDQMGGQAWIARHPQVRFVVHRSGTGRQR